MLTSHREIHLTIAIDTMIAVMVVMAVMVVVAVMEVLVAAVGISRGRRGGAPHRQFWIPL